MTVAAGLLAFVVILTILVLVHEAGHFTFARLTGVRVDEFGLGFPPRIKAWRRGDTIYSINAIPLGGFVRMLGENGEAERPDSFGSKAPWKRLVVLAAGPCMNLLLALAIFFFAYVIGSPRGITVITGISPNSPAARVGLRVGDRITAIDSMPVRWFDQVAADTTARVGTRIRVTLMRGGRRLIVSLVPRRHPPASQGPIGISLGDTATASYAPADALGRSFGDVAGMVVSVPAILQTVFASHGAGVEGPIGMAHTTTNVVGQAPKQGPGTILELAALLSANLGVLNLLPIPALDGGRIVFVLLAWLRRRNLDPQLEGMFHVAGMAALMLLILFVSYQDIVRWITGASF